MQTYRVAARDPATGLWKFKLYDAENPKLAIDAAMADIGDTYDFEVEAYRTSLNVSRAVKLWALAALVVAIGVYFWVAP